MMKPSDTPQVHIEDNAFPYALRNETFAAALLDPDIDIPVGVGKAKNNQAPKRFSIYRNNVVVSLMDAMASSFPSLLTIMGEENFKRVSRNFILNHPPSTPMMQQYGRAFPEFLSGFKPLAKSPFLADVARAELSWINAYHAQDAGILTPEELQSIDPDKIMELVLTPHPAFHILSSSYPIVDLFNARSEWPKPGLDIGQVQTLVITRPNFDCFANEVEESIGSFLSLLASGISLGDAISTTNETHTDFDATTSISTLLQIGGFMSLENAK